ncbi:unnamed protein product [Thelazia callipaeda]|uniref:G-patch domain-containing protein n=1 Tax=Thelazia callipaeda TaxID=103827 RepID=A0A158RBT1_THECL|nr:unnamed protein product [Thelazia callipaeda]
MAKDENDMAEPSSSDAIIASLINDVRRTNEPFDVKNLISGKSEAGNKMEGESDVSFSSSCMESKKCRRHKEKKIRKNKKTKHKSRPKSRSPSAKKKKYKSRSNSSLEEEDFDRSMKIVNYAIPPSVEAIMEKISDDEDDLPVGADFLSVNASSSKINEKVEELLQDVPIAVRNKTKEFKVNEEVFPLAKKRKKSESPPVVRKPRPLSEILAKVRAERDNAFIPRNIKLKQENGRSGTGPPADLLSHSCSKGSGSKPNDVEYGPKPLGALQPISDDDNDDLLVSSRKVQEPVISQSVRTTNTTKILMNNAEKGRTAIREELPHSRVNICSSNGGSTEETISDRHSASEQELSGKESERGICGKKRRERKYKKRDTRYSRRSNSSTSDSEKEWNHLLKNLIISRNKIMEHSQASRREFDRNRRRQSSFLLSYYVDSNKKVHEGSKWRWSRGDKDSNAVPTILRSKNWRQYSTKSPYTERKRRRSSSSSYSRTHSRTRSSSEISSRSSHSSYYRGSHHRHGQHYHRRDRRSSSRRRCDDDSNCLKIDKKKLLEIARKNAAQMAQLGHLPNTTEAKTQLKSGGQSVDQLVVFCQKLQQSQDKDERRQKGEVVSSDDEDLAPRRKKNEDEIDFVKHPFALKPTAPITINIPNSIPLPIKTPAQRTLEESQLRITYPVSSGLQHREKDSEWVPVKKEEIPSVCNSSQKSKLSSVAQLSEDEKVCYNFNLTNSKSLILIEIHLYLIVYHRTITSVFSDFGTITADMFVLPPPPTPPVLASFTQPASYLLHLPPPPPPPDLGAEYANPSSHNQSQNITGNLNYGNVVTVPEEESVFRESKSLHTPSNVGRVMADRVRATKMLAKDPNDYQARRLLNEADQQAILLIIQTLRKIWDLAVNIIHFSCDYLFHLPNLCVLFHDLEINAWAESKRSLPGKFTGSTGVEVLNAHQLGPNNSRFSLWAKKDFLKQANVVNSDVGLKLMQKMGWTPGEGLGKGKDGPLEPLMLDIKSDRKGLVATEELQGLKKSRSNFCCNVTGKHPVSMLMEYCSKKKWPTPKFTCLETGPPNNRRFLWKAVVNDVEYQPAIPSSSKKTGKAHACQIALQSLGLLARDSPLPVLL